MLQMRKYKCGKPVGQDLCSALTQARLQNGWFTDATGQRQEQSMIFSPDHPKFPDQLKGMKQVLTE